MLALEVAFAAPYEPGDVVVYVQQEGEPVAGLAVRVDGNQVGTTDAAGMLDFEVAEGRRRIEILDEGSTEAELPLLVETDTSFELAVALGSRGREPEFRIRSFPAGEEVVVSGVVRSEAGEPLGEVVVSAAGQSQSARTDAAGRFELSVPRGRYTLTARSSDTQQRRFTDVRALGSLSGDLDLALAARSASASGAIEEVVVVGRLVPDTRSRSNERRFRCSTP
ncbi:MAG: carboxypeptidase regulatory-like domain-containing protein [Gammaproteobacteria bacterium]|nr:carboxypeptidase regulatory-like domain-containing protein [Gammaproteobacteria bacterium]